jgi:Domain of unknown function (DUF4158)
MTPTAARVIHPEQQDPLTPGYLQQLLSPSFDERMLTQTVTRAPEAQVALLVKLETFQTIGRFLPVFDIPPVAIGYVAHRMDVGSGSNLIFRTARRIDIVRLS